MDSRLASLIDVLQGGRMSLDEAQDSVANVAGLYAVHGVAAVWQELGLGSPPDNRPLYVGKAEVSLRSRDLDTHFGTGRTGSSTVRRSFAALLRAPLGLSARPRNPSKPERPANYGLPPEQDARLTDWMRANLVLSVWLSNGHWELRQVERDVLIAIEPPLNLTHVHTHWTTHVKAARRVMADQARSQMSIG
jgi:hypothetical protein